MSANAANFSFVGGTHPHDKKELARSQPIEDYRPTAGECVFPMSQHIGAPCSPIVKKGDRVLVGTKIGDSDAFVSAPIFSSVSGTVKDVGPRLTISGDNILSVVVENDGQYEMSGDIRPRDNYLDLSPDEYRKIIRGSGIVGLGGAAFPTAIKLSPPPDKPIDTVIVNAAECEPYLTCDDRLMREDPEKIVEGLRIVLRILPGAAGIIAIEKNKPEAIAAMQKAAEPFANEKISVVPVKTKYPQGAEKMLIYALTKRQTPFNGALPADVGCVIQNTRTVWQIWKSVAEGVPLIERVVTVTGEAIATPKNIRTPLGVSVRELIDLCGGFREAPGKIIGGGPFMGMTMASIDVPIVKGTSGILALPESSLKDVPESNCLRCGRCVTACPMFLLPSTLNQLVLARSYEEFEQLGGFNCIECGSCTYVCPSHRLLTQACRDGKRSVTALRRERAIAAQRAKEKSEKKENETAVKA